MNQRNVRAIVTLSGLALIGWACCAAIMGIGLQVTTQSTTLLLHAIAAPLIFGALSAFYFTRFHYTSPLQTALIFTGVVIVMDTVVVALLLLHSFAMFASVEGTWLPFALIFASTYLVGVVIDRTASLRHARG
jgi:multisubunit Na+/H+ antiporter MnhC subunit